MSKKVVKHAKAATALPLVSVHWWTFSKTVAHCRAHKCDKEIGNLTLLAAVNRGELPVKVEWFDQQTSPPAQGIILPSAEDYVLTGSVFDAEWSLLPRRPDVPRLPRLYALFFWGPKVKELWPMEEAASVLAQQQAADPFKPPRRRPGPAAENEWKQVVVRELLKRAKAGKPLPSAPEMQEFCGGVLEFEPDLRSMQELLQRFAGEMWYLLGLG